ncbi:glycosyltransferase [Aliifodinibius salipaludis]|uniref:Glycosyltransferase n=1 Tax=Fodinibius salipaludis TaxID=2032627 RepID=A0A2A2G8J6_9BACT|nr:glycosyltransferase family 2 protein [Aliifodinibius salipaludis]PAU93169.1 glycosyltransferase [Aliifodinibius salipaludis]
MNDFNKTIAVLMTCHNRRKKTMACLDSLFAQSDLPNVELTVYLVDDGSNDGTAEAVKENYPDVNILKGDGSLYWTGGMHKSMAAAMDQGFDLYLWLNDDTILYPDALQNLIAVYRDHEQKNNTGIVVGSLCDPDTGEWTYGASIKTSYWHPLKFEPIEPGENVKEADNFWGNVVLVPQEIVDRIGNLDNNFDHGGADHDYALRTKKAGYKIWVAPGYVGECPRNPIEGTWKDRSLPFIQRLRKLLSIKNQSLSHRFYFLRKHGGFLFPIIFFTPYVGLVYDHFIKPFIGNRKKEIKNNL